MTRFVTVLASFFLVAPAMLLQDPGDARINNSFIAFTIPEKDLLPESVAYDPVEGCFYVGSTRKGKIVKVTRAGDVTDFIAPRQDGLWMVIGIKVDAERRTLWVASSAGENLVGYRRGDGSPAGIFSFDLATGKLIKKYVLDNAGEVHFFNDVVVTARGDVFATHMFRESAIYKISRDTASLVLFSKPEGFTEPNGIALSPDGRLLFVAHDEGISAFDTETGSRRELLQVEDVSLRGIDGLYFYKESLIAIHPGRKAVRRYFLDSGRLGVTRAVTIEAQHPLFDGPTTGVLVGDTFFYIANAQFGSVAEDGSLPPMERLYEPVILKTLLKD